MVSRFLLCWSPNGRLILFSLAPSRCSRSWSVGHRMAAVFLFSLASRWCAVPPLSGSKNACSFLLSLASRWCPSSCPLRRQIAASSPSLCRRDGAQFFLFPAPKRLLFPFSLTQSLRAQTCCGSPRRPRPWPLPSSLLCAESPRSNLMWFTTTTTSMASYSSLFCAESLRSNLLWFSGSTLSTKFVFPTTT